MNLDNFIDDIFCDGGVISKFKDGYKERPSQIEASKLILDVLSRKDIMLLEGETGFGKSFAYLVPALIDVVNYDLKHKVIIVTSGISLQEQLFNKDVPFVRKVICDYFKDVKEKDIKITLFKGRQNFICNYKANQAGVSDKLADTRYKEIGEFMKRDKSGDLSKLEFVPDLDVLENVTCSKPRECLGKKCEFRQECYYEKHKEDLDVSNVIITNYHMLFSNIKTGGKLLPQADTLILDEAHEIAKICRDFNSIRFSQTTASFIRNKCSELINLNSEYESILDTDFITSFMNINMLVFNSMIQMFGGQDSVTLITKTSQLPESFFDLKNDLDTIKSQVMTCSNKALNDLDNCNDSSEKELIAKELSVIEDMSESIDNMYEFLIDLDDTLKDSNNVVWFEIVNSTASLNKKEVNIGNIIKRQLLTEWSSVILTSATISTGGDFQYIREQLGLDLSEKRKVEFIGSSPFNLTEQQLWYLPENTIDGNKRGFDDMLPQQVCEIIKATNGGALCLFTSIRNMRNTYYELSRLLKGEFKILVQGDKPKSKLIEEFKQDENSILLGTRSFFTGIDVPGKSLRCVIVDKFPFPQPSDPIQQRLNEEPNAFYRYSIPEMIITLKQAIGRGVRDVNDKCVVSIIDGRMATARYKHKINRSFDYKKTGTRNLKDVKEFCDKYLNE